MVVRMGDCAFVLDVFVQESTVRQMGRKLFSCVEKDDLSVREVPLSEEASGAVDISASVYENVRYDDGASENSVLFAAAIESISRAYPSKQWMRALSNATLLNRLPARGLMIRGRLMKN